MSGIIVRKLVRQLFNGGDWLITWNLPIGILTRHSRGLGMKEIL